MTSDRSVEQLFALLREQAAAPAAAVPGKQPEELTLDDPAERDAQQAFEQIDQNLRKLPRLRNEFDALAQGQAQHRPVLPAKPQTTSGADWFLLPKPDKAARDRAQRDLLLLKHRAALDPKRHYKKDRWQVPERFALGTVIDTGTGPSAGSAGNHRAGASMLDSLLGDADTQRYFKRKYAQIQQQRSSNRRRRPATPTARNRKRR